MGIGVSSRKIGNLGAAKSSGLARAMIFGLLLGALILPSSLLAQRGGQRGGPGGEGPPPTPVVVFETQLVPFADHIEALGTLRANETVQLTAPVADTITAIHFEDGQRVEAGHVLIEMTNAEEQALLSEARAQYNRAQNLVERGSISQSMLDQRRRDYETTRARLQDRLIIAPYDGVVGLRMHSVGSYVSPGQVITTLHNDGVMKLDFAIPEVQLTAITVDQVINATASAFPGQTFQGVVASIDAAIDPVTRSIQVRAIIPNEDRRLRPGLLMTVRLRRNERSAIVIPESAIIVEARDRYVWVVGEDGTSANKRFVELGTRNIGEIEILQGLEVGEQVITRGAANLRPGARINIRAVDSGGESLSDLLDQER